MNAMHAGLLAFTGSAYPVTRKPAVDESPTFS